MDEDAQGFFFSRKIGRGDPRMWVCSLAANQEANDSTLIQWHWALSG